MTENAGILSVAIGMPKTVRDNAWFKENYPREYEAFEERTLAQVFAAQGRPNEFTEAMLPFLSDPFRGTKERRILDADKSPIDLERDTALSAIHAAGLAVEDVDAILVAAFPTEHQGIGDGVYLARALGTRVPAWNVETACSGGVAALQLASAMVSSGQARRVLVVVSCIYSRACDWSDTLTWFLGDGVGAYVVGAVPAGEGFAAFHAVNTAESCGAFAYALEPDSEGGARQVIRAGRSAGKALRDLTPRAVRDVCSGALRRAGIDKNDVDLFVANTPLAWFNQMFADTLGVDVSRTISTYSEVANIGPALNVVNLHAALRASRVAPGSIVLLFSIGSVASAAAAVMRVGKVAVGNVIEH
jgi:3-oxoacyl-[acyl-carrier-protein] synthase-3